MNKLKGYRTVIFNIIMTLVMFWQVQQPDVELPTADHVNQSLDAVEAVVTVLWGIGNLFLRAWTDSPIFEKESP
jgi:hypothetical protein